MVKDNILLKAGAFIALSLVAFKGLSFETNVDSQVVGADLTITEVNNDGGDLTVGGTLTVNGVQNASVPAGVIVMWSGETNAIPAGWALCDGQNNTPNLQGRFVVGYSGSGDYGTVGNEGGSDQRTLSEANMPSHRHVLKGDDGGYVPAGSQAYPKISVLDNENNLYSTDRGAFNTDAREQYITELTGGGQQFDNRPAYYVLAYIMKL